MQADTMCASSFHGGHGQHLKVPVWSPLSCLLMHRLAPQKGTTGEESASFIPGPPKPEQPRPSIYLLAGAVLYGPQFPGRALWREGKPLLWDKASRAHVGLGNTTLNPAKGFTYCRTSQTLQVSQPTGLQSPFFSWSIFGVTCLLRQSGME